MFKISEIALGMALGLALISLPIADAFAADQYAPVSEKRVVVKHRGYRAGVYPCPDGYGCYPLYGAYGPYGGHAYWNSFSYVVPSYTSPRP